MTTADSDAEWQAVDALVVIDFYDADQTQRNAFANTIEIGGWQHHPVLPNTFCRTFEDCFDDDRLVESCEQTMAHAATAVQLLHWDAVCVLGDPGWSGGCIRSQDR